MKRFSLIVAFMAVVLGVMAQNKSFSVGDGKGYMFAYKFEGKFYIILGYQEEENLLPKKAILKFKFADGKVIRLEGEECAYYMVPKLGFEGRVVNKGLIYMTRFYSFPITQQQIEMFNGSLSKIQLNTLPNVLSVSISNENFSKDFYESFLNQKDDF